MDHFHCFVAASAAAAAVPQAAHTRTHVLTEEETSSGGETPHHPATTIRAVRGATLPFPVSSSYSFCCYNDNDDDDGGEQTIFRLSAGQPFSVFLTWDPPVPLEQAARPFRESGGKMPHRFLLVVAVDAPTLYGNSGSCTILPSHS
uniref:Putative secreted protein n=1 Tax=Anopheles marajoara TaxID=58244 RepID=A0A2M4C6M5_9DIPT